MHPCSHTGQHQSEEMCSGSEACSYLRFIDVVYHSTLGVRVIKKKKKSSEDPARTQRDAPLPSDQGTPYSYLRLIDFVYHSTLGLRLIKKKKREHLKVSTTLA